MPSVDSAPSERAERQNRVRIATELLPALGLGPYRRSSSQRNVASETTSGAPEGSPQKDRQAPEGPIRDLIDRLRYMPTLYPCEGDMFAMSRHDLRVFLHARTDAANVLEGRIASQTPVILDGIPTAMVADEPTWYTPTIMGTVVRCPCGFESWLTLTTMGDGAYRASIEAGHYASLRFHHANCLKARTPPDSEEPSGATEA